MIHEYLKYFKVIQNHFNQIYSTHSWDPNKYYYHSRSNERMIPDSPRLKNWILTIGYRVVKLIVVIDGRFSQKKKKKTIQDNFE